jgi:hypothetical protein
MPHNLNETIQQIKAAGANNARAVPMSGQSVANGDYQIEIKESNSWKVVMSGIKKQMAEDLIAQAVNRVILG